eukprot:125186-Alexandrium_andersonii.AAC.1
MPRTKPPHQLTLRTPASAAAGPTAAWRHPQKHAMVASLRSEACGTSADHRPGGRKREGRGREGEPTCRALAAGA